MPSKKVKRDVKNVQYDMSMQDQYAEKCPPNFFKNFKPPPPPGSEDLWELQFCRWWGWNWVRRKEEQPKPQDQEQDNTQRERKPEKKQFKTLCNCLCFKKEQKASPNLQKLYDTPSHSLVPKRGCDSCDPENKIDLFTQLEHQRNISQKGKREICEGKSIEVQSWTKTPKYETSSSSANCCCCRLERYRSSTEESIEYININCCPCCHPKKKSTPTKCNCETQTSRHINVNVTQTSKPDNGNICATQTCRKSKKKHIRLICCHCSQNYCCNCTCKCPQPTEKQCKCEKESTPAEGDESCKSNCKAECNLTPRFETVYMSGMKYPLNTMLYFNKRFSKFGNPSQNYPWLHGVKSDISDRIYSMKIEKEFSSPISGNIYNLMPEKFDTFEKETTLPDPIEVTEELKFLKKLESEAKIDLENRIMLDAVCDAILTDAKTSSSAILNQFTYSYDTESENAIRGQNNTENKYKFHKCPNYTLDEMNYSNVFKDVENEIFTSHLDNDRINTYLDFDQGSNLRKGPNTLKRLLEMNTLSDTTTEQWPGNYTFSHTETNTRDDWGKSTDTSVPNISDIFNKIDEIVLKSKVNNEEIQNVINAIPKYHCQTRPPEENSLLITKSLTKCISKVEQYTYSNTNLEEKDQTTSNRNSDIKGVRKINKKKKAHRSSLIPIKTVDKPKVNKKSNN